MRDQFAHLGINRMWFVIMPTKHSTIHDILFVIGTWRDLKFTFDGGLDPDEILATFDNEDSARSSAEQVIAGTVEF